MPSFDGLITEFGAKDTNGYFHRKSYFVKDDNYYLNKKRYIEKYNNTDVYQCAYYYENNDYDNCIIAGDPYLDFDIDDIEINYKKLTRSVKYCLNYIKNNMGVQPEELKIYFSGSKGFHVVIPAEIIGISPAKNLNEEFKNFAFGLAFLSCGRKTELIPQCALDLKIYDRKRLFRVVNSINSKSGLYKVPVNIDQLYDFDWEQMKQWASKPRLMLHKTPVFSKKAQNGYLNILDIALKCQGKDNSQKKKSSKKIELKEGEKLELLPCTLALLKTGAIKGCRNHSLFALASSLFQSGYNVTEVFDTVEAWNSNNDEPLIEREIETTVLSALNSYETGMIVGCGKYKELGYCQEEKCKLMQ